MKHIELTQGKFALVDDEDFECLNKWKWYAVKRRHKYYAVRGRRKADGKGPHLISMHNSICERTQVDHKDGDGLNNQRENLRPCNNSQNAANKKLQSNNKSGYRGIHIEKKIRKWRARIKVNGKEIHLGYFDDKIEAAKAYNEAALQYFGEFAMLNEISNRPTASHN